MGALYDQMKMDLELKNFSPKTIRCYLDCMVHFVRHYGRSPMEMGEEEIRNYLHYLIKEKEASQSSINQAYSAMKFFYTVTLGRAWNEARIPRSKSRKKLPIVLSMQEVQSLLASVENLKHQAILTTIYSAGLRLGEATRLRVSDIDSKRMTILVRQGKGNKDRYTVLGQQTLQLLRLYWKTCHPADWLFPSKDPAQPLSGSSVQRVFKKALHRAGIKKKASVHTLRHSFATHLLESGTDLYHIQRLLGHSTAKTTSVYLHITGKGLAKVKSPIDLLPNDQKPTP
ncbi:MAG: integrase [Deltaproteobacteria bacterium]|nr:MAG: integrase [Deltaproteobacteria bacterium]